MTATLEQPVKYRAPERYQTHDEEDFEVFPDVPVFKEHENDEGEVYDRPKLEAIIDKCNRRISDTGDYATVVVGHTPDDSEHEQPQVIGLAGPYKLGVVGEDEPKWAILADFRIFHKDVETFRSNPRRSVEIWKEETPDGVEIHFDPIAVLGGVAPKLDLGLVYSKSRHGKVPERHEMTIGENTSTTLTSVSHMFIPTDGGTAQQPERYEMSTPSGANTFIPTTDGSGKKNPERNNKEQDMDPQADAGAMWEVLKPMIQQLIDDNKAVVPATEEVPGAVPNFDPEQMGHMGAKFAKYAKEDEDDDNNGALKFMETHDEEESAHFRKYMGDHDDDRLKDMYNRIDGYMKSDNYAAGSEYKCPDEENSEQYSAEKYRKETTELRDKYRKEAADHKVLKEKYAKEKADNEGLRKSEKYSKQEAIFTNFVMDGIVLNVAEEIKTVENFTDEQFANHIKTIPEKYGRIPGGVVPVLGEAPQPIKNGDTKQAEKYSAEAHAVCTKMRNANPRANIEYQEVHANITKNNGEYVAA